MNKVIKDGQGSKKVLYTIKEREPVYPYDKLISIKEVFAENLEEAKQLADACTDEYSNVLIIRYYSTHVYDILSCKFRKRWRDDDIVTALDKKKVLYTIKEREPVYPYDKLISTTEVLAENLEEAKKKADACTDKNSNVLIIRYYDIHVYDILSCKLRRSWRDDKYYSYWNK